MDRKRATVARRDLGKVLQNALVLLALSLAGFGQDPNAAVRPYSLEKEIALGRQVAGEIDERSELLQDPIVTAYVNRLVESLAWNADAPFPFTVKVIDSEEAGGVALPGGFLFVRTGLILRAQTLAELAGFVAHQIAHVAARHGLQQASSGQTTDSATTSLIFLGTRSGLCDRMPSGTKSPISFRSVMRDNEEGGLAA